MRPANLILAVALIGLAAVSFGAERQPTFDIELGCAESPPGEDTDVGRLFDFAETHDGELVYAEIAFRTNCECNSGTRFLKKLTLACARNDQFYLYEATRDYRCVQSLHLAGGNAGIASLCFPRPDDLPLRPGYSADIRAVEVTVRGVFLTYWDWSGGAPHVTLLVPESGTERMR